MVKIFLYLVLTERFETGEFIIEEDAILYLIPFLLPICYVFDGMQIPQWLILW